MRVPSRPAFAGCLLLLACRKEPEPAEVEGRVQEAKAPPTLTVAPAESPGAAAQPRETTYAYRFPAVPKLVAIGDLHGDAQATRQVFQLAGAVDKAGHWNGGSLTVVQVGDQLDRGDGEAEILDFLDRVASEAERAGGRLIVLNGNHEIMNAQGDFRYVTPGAVHAFDQVTPRATAAARYPGDFQGRAAAFLPGGGTALRLARRNVIVQVGDTVFAHAGVRAPHVDYGIDRLNRDAQAWFRGELSMPPRLLTDEEGPVWTRIYGAPDMASNACSVLIQALGRLGARRMVVGHTVQTAGVNGACSDQVFRVDVGLSAHYGSGPIQALMIEDDKVKVLSAPREP